MYGLEGSLFGRSSELNLQFLVTWQWKKISNASSFCCQQIYDPPFCFNCSSVKFCNICDIIILLFLVHTYNFLENFFSNTSPKSKERVILETPHEHFTQSLGHSPWCSQNWRCNEIPKWEWGLIEFDTYKNSLSTTVKKRVHSSKEVCTRYIDSARCLLSKSQWSEYFVYF